MSHMKMQALPPAEHSYTAYEASPQHRAGGEAEHLPGPPHDWTAAMHDRDWTAAGETPESAGEALQCPGPEGRAVHDPPEQEHDPRELFRRLSALNLAEREVPSVRGRRYNEERRLRGYGDLKLRFPDASYPEPLSIEGSPRRRARSLPWNSIPEADIEDDDSPLLCCCKLKKRVQFADALGLCLASVKHFLPSDEPLVPQAVLARLQSYHPTVPVPRPESPLLEEGCVSECPIPVDLLGKLEERRVCLEQVSATAWGISGHILVKDPEENVQVKIRYTFNEWLSFLDCPASAALQSPAPGIQRFHFNLCYPPSTSFIHFAICFTTGQGQEIWDNNQGVNYTVSCQQSLPSEVQPSNPDQEEGEGQQLW